MTEPHLDRLARLLSGSRSRRQALVALGVLTFARPRRASAASQIEPAACGDSGAVCTQLKDCCSGLVCATSTRNPTYGVCVTGEGDMLAVTDDLIVPGTPGLAEELAALVADAAAAPAALPSRGTAPTDTGITTGGAKTTTSTSPFTNTNTNTQRAKPPRLDLKLVDNNLDPAKPEILTVHNEAGVPVEITRIRSIVKSSTADSRETIEIADGDTLELHSGERAVEPNVWTTVDICLDLDDGVVLTVNRLGSTERYHHKVLCEQEASPPAATATTRQSRKNTSTKRRGQKQPKRGQKPSRRRKGQ